ncbi:hypothetical protein [Haloplanus aerogenes]|uniref:DUF7979 domain-containing protein n=1 Tax=Haloplanus aerogenes TaxID=660522 RepID=A0A3M0DH76_9EURY|nr:hypothetical protein [Haloplanus aerogenes]AZH26071.1 hypothetical protein DU502_12200 [Haloplanus aerogenes]RMB18479.1 hypothetical protein ATH50_1937 [Haloplanus aerogenes]
MVPRPTLPTALIGVGLALLLVSTAPSTGTTDTDYAHHVEPAENGALAYGLEYDESDVLAYENLSVRGQQVFDRARADSPYVVENESATAPDFSYTSDNVAVGEGLYPVRYEGEVYSLRTERESGGFNAAAWLVGLVTRGLGVVCVVAGLVLAGWRRYRYSSD